MNCFNVLDKTRNSSITINLSNKTCACIGWWDNRSLKYKTYYKNENKWPMFNCELHGTYSVWYSDGQLKEKSYYMNGGLHGERLVYYYTGQLMEKSHWKNGNLHGKYLWYHDNGQLWKKSYWNNGEEITEEEYNELF